MGDFAKLIGRFFDRDFFYLAGGAVSLSCLLFVVITFTELRTIIGEIKNIETMLVVPIGGLAYAWGFTISQVSAYLHFTTNNSWLSLKESQLRLRIAHHLFRRFMGFSSDDLIALVRNSNSVVDHQSAVQSFIDFIAATDEGKNAMYSRTSTLRHLACTFGPNFFLGGVFLLVGCVFNTNINWIVYLNFSLALLISGGFLSLLSHFHAVVEAFVRVMQLPSNHE